MPQVEFEILQTIPQISTEPGREGKEDRIVTFQAVDGRAGFVRIPGETFSAEAVRKAVGEELKKQSQMVGQKMKADV